MTTDLSHSALAGIACAVVAACLFAAGVTMQHRAVTATGAGRRVVGAVVRTPGWLVGIGLGMVGGGLHVVALTFAPVAVVEPVGVLGLVLIVVVGARTRGERVDDPTRRAVGAVCVGIGGFVVLAAGALGAQAVAQVGQVQVVVVGAGLVAAVGVRARGCVGISAAAAVVSGLGSTVIHAAAQHWTGGGGVGENLLLSAEAAALMLTGGWLMQQAYARGSAALVVGTTTVLGPITSVLLSLTLYGETTPTTEIIAAQLALTLLAIAGVRTLAHAIPTDTRPRAAEAPEPAHAA
ncbi:hypothetical protein [Actinokineospora enzanensis]|uniref:hypothetical protein n=1 Tax=Actinokineospora enzanensis TaxID=155975 RepID=UPI0003A2A338|nr:hypothetical protein [Actinokineospora enzanensis]